MSMSYLQRLWPARVPVPPAPTPVPRRLPLKRPARAGRAGMAPWQQVAPVRRRGH
ncbi:hypothetical protein [Stenotrophomonas sp. 24(2023)]|uniref:hypothetical protein n=1 Tax=Stenotrophomonas sp. 24(2023) TaxID=3068324 RepID=UPI0027E16A23|nr:hypothetical protein [Stenotrophomonas sp. 24(2023)]WMJ68090.1 hypothetical protein Q9R17_12870 [Stenotrophomonas sp. 24(2023)]